MNKYGYDVSGAKRKYSKPAGYAFVEDSTLITGRKSLEEGLGCTLTSIEQDLLRLSSTIFAADRASLRGDRENLTRRIELRVPVSNVEVFLPLAAKIEYLLRELSQDVWRLQFVARANKDADGPDEDGLKFPAATGKALLFSGGLDSLAAAVEFSKAATPLLLVSHRTHNPVTDQAQRNLVDLLSSAGHNIQHLQVFVSSRDDKESGLVHAVEASQRTRSFVFLVAGAISARRLGKSEVVYMAENGQLAIHLPLTSARTGAFSTRTAHPTVLSLAQVILSEILQFKLTIENPYLYLTKAQVVAKVRAGLPKGIAVSTSCWKNARLVGAAKHCGECVPCIIRRIAVETTGSDPTAYARDAFATPVEKLEADDDARRNLYDIAEFVSLFRSAPDHELLMEFPDLLTGPMDAKAALRMYRRFAGEAVSVLSKYSSMAALLS